MPAAPGSPRKKISRSAVNVPPAFPGKNIWAQRRAATPEPQRSFPTMQETQPRKTTLRSPRQRSRTGPKRRNPLALEQLESRLVPAALPRPDHIVIVIEENHTFSQIIGSVA